MPSRPAKSGYARIAQAEEEEEEDSTLLGSDDDEQTALHNSRTISSHYEGQFVPIQPGRRERMQAYDRNSVTPTKSSHSRTNSASHGGRRRRRTNSGVDIKAINARLERWAEEIADKFKMRKITGKTHDEEQLEIHHSVFHAPEGIQPADGSSPIDQLHDIEANNTQRMARLDFDEKIEAVRVAIEHGIHPKIVSQGSSGSYFAQTSQRKVVGIFKPKDEEPYATKNPKWTKWAHRNLLPFFFGRACLIPNLSYVSEAAAYVLDCRLRTNLVPYTDVVALSSKSFFYDFWERRAFYRRKKPLPDKQGSFQVFLKGFKDANVFLREHPWPDQVDTPRLRFGRSRSKLKWRQECGPNLGSGSASETLADIPDEEEEARREEFWTPELQQSFREQLEKLVILDYIMRNTDRGLDNWMIKIEEVDDDVKEDPNDIGNAHKDEEPIFRNESMTLNKKPKAIVSIGAIDNSLSWPWKHPDAWRSFPFGWLFLPVTLIGRPFSENTKQHFIPLLSSKSWWSETQIALRQCFEKDVDFSERMFARQIAVMKGQAWNVLETLKTPDHGPLELTRRARVCVWDDLVDIPVATPLRAPSVEARRRRYETPPRRGRTNNDEEMDISAALESQSVNDYDLLDLSKSAGDVVEQNPFNKSRQNSSGAKVALGEGDIGGPLSLTSINGFSMSQSTIQEPTSRKQRHNSGRVRHSMDDAKHLLDGLADRRRFSQARSRRGTLSSGQDENDGDLGYAAAEDQEHNRRKVIVERLEMVKGRNPVFTCW